jgi:hypothetical protein
MAAPIMVGASGRANKGSRDFRAVFHDFNSEFSFLAPIAGLKGVEGGAKGGAIFFCSFLLPASVLRLYPEPKPNAASVQNNRIRMICFILTDDLLHKSKQKLKTTIVGQALMAGLAEASRVFQ